MLTFKLISVIDGFYHYEIYPESKLEDKETLIFNPTSKEVKESTFIGFNRKYLLHFLQGFKDKEGNYRVEGMVAW